jgi:hypothetical protein
VIRRRRLLWGAALLVLAGLVLLTPTAQDPDATVAVRRYLANLGFEVVDDAAPPPPDRTLVLLHDVRAEAEAEALLAWAERGGDLVVADPNSAVVALAGAVPAGPIGFAGTVELEPECIAPAAVGVGRLSAQASDLALASTEEDFVSCFPTADGAFLLTRRHGEGTVTLLGGSSPFTNALLTEADNASLAAQLAAPGRAIVFGPPSAPGAAGTGVWEALPERARAAIVGVVVAGVAFALVRARRLGRPALEEPIAPIPGSELVGATARMYRRARAAAYAGGLMREAGVARLARRLRAAGRDHGLIDALARASGLPRARVADILEGPDPRNDEELINLGRELEELAARAEQESR